MSSRKVKETTSSAWLPKLDLNKDDSNRYPNMERLNPRQRTTGNKKTQRTSADGGIVFPREGLIANTKYSVLKS